MDASRSSREKARRIFERRLWRRRREEKEEQESDDDDYGEGRGRVDVGTVPVSVCERRERELRR